MKYANLETTKQFLVDAIFYQLYAELRNRLTNHLHVLEIEK